MTEVVLQSTWWGRRHKLVAGCQSKIVVRSKDQIIEGGKRKSGRKERRLVMKAAVTALASD
jgi:hypothetical protein